MGCHIPTGLDVVHYETRQSWSRGAGGYEAGEEGADEKLEIISVVDILAIVALEQGKLSAPSMFNLKCKLFALRNRRSIERDEELDVPKLASAVPLSKLSKRSRPKVHDAIANSRSCKRRLSSRPLFAQLRTPQAQKKLNL